MDAFTSLNSPNSALGTYTDVFEVNKVDSFLEDLTDFSNKFGEDMKY